MARPWNAVTSASAGEWVEPDVTSLASLAPGTLSKVERQRAIGFDAMPLDSFTRLASLDPAQFSEGSRRTYTYTVRYFLGALVRRRPDLLKLSFDQLAMPEAIAEYCQDLLESKTRVAGALKEFDLFVSAAKALAPNADWASAIAFSHADLRDRVDRAERMGSLKPARALPVALHPSEMPARDFDALVEAFKPRGHCTDTSGNAAKGDDDGSFAEGRQIALEDDNVVEADEADLEERLERMNAGGCDDTSSSLDGLGSYDCALSHIYRSLLGTISRQRPDLLCVRNEDRFGRDMIERFADERGSVGNPAAILSRLRALRFALRRIWPEFDCRYILDVIAERRARLIADGHLPPLLTTAEMLPFDDLPLAVRQRFSDAVGRKNARASRDHALRLQRESAEIVNPHRRRYDRWQKDVSEAGAIMLLSALRTYAGFKKRRDGEVTEALLAPLDVTTMDDFVAELRRSCVPHTIASILERLRRVLFRMGVPLSELEELARRAAKIRREYRRTVWTSRLRPRRIVREALAAAAD